MKKLSILSAIFAATVALISPASAQILGFDLGSRLPKALDYLDSSCEKVEYSKSKYTGYGCSFPYLPEFENSVVSVWYEGLVFKEVSSYWIHSLAGHKLKPRAVLEHFSNNTLTYRYDDGCRPSERNRFPCKDLNFYAPVRRDCPSWDVYPDIHEGSVVCQETYRKPAPGSYGTDYYEIGLSKYNRTETEEAYNLFHIMAHRSQ